MSCNTDIAAIKSRLPSLNGQSAQFRFKHGKKMSEKETKLKNTPNPNIEVATAEVVDKSSPQHSNAIRIKSAVSGGRIERVQSASEHEAGAIANDAGLVNWTLNHMDMVDIDSTDTLDEYVNSLLDATYADFVKNRPHQRQTEEPGSSTKSKHRSDSNDKCAKRQKRGAHSMGVAVTDLLPTDIPKLCLDLL